MGQNYTNPKMMRLTYLVKLISFGILVALFGFATAQSLPEKARTSGGKPVTSGVLSDIFPKSIEELTAKSDAVVITMLTRGRTSLTPDEKYLFTPYEMSNIRVVAGALPSLSGALGKVNPFTLIHGGGEIILDGVPVRSVDYNFPNGFKNGQHLVFVKRYRAEPGQYQIYNGGIFAIDSDQLRPVASGSATLFAEIKGTPISQMVSRIQIAAKPR